MKKLFRVLRYARNYKGLCALNVLFNLLASVFELFSLTLLIPFLELLFRRSMEDYEGFVAAGEPAFDGSVQAGIDLFYYHFSRLILTDPENGKVNALVFICVLIIMMIFIKNLCRYMALFFIAKVRNGAMRDIRNRLFQKCLNLPLSYYSRERKGDIMARITNDVQEIEWTIMTSIELLFKEPFAIALYLGTMIYWSPQLTLFVLILLPVTGLIIGRIGKSLKETSVKGQAKMGQLISVIEETLGGLRIIKAFNAEASTKRKFRDMNESYRKLMVGMYRKRDLSSPLSEFLGVAVMVVVVWFGGNLVMGNDFFGAGRPMPAEVFITYIALFTRLIPPAKAITTTYYNIQKGAASEERIAEVMSTVNTITEKPDARPVEEFTKEIEYRNVSFRYQTEEVLHGISLKVQKGQTVALVGPSGGGKSTLADLLPRFYNPAEGEIRIDGVSIRDYRIKDLRGLMGIVSQESILFNDTVFNNIAFGKEKATQAEVERAARIANAHEFIMQMADGYQSNIGDRGGRLSGGQRQRLSIARAVLKNPPILILDEATSALDTESEQLVQEALDKLMENRTSLVIAHRLSTIQNADIIYVIESGRVAESGTHRELLKASGTYRKLYDLQAFS